jgi:branched-chain amino acid transport system ATP-binding protein
MLKICQINFYYDKLQALADVTLEVRQGECVAVIGSNGAGKTSLLRVISGIYHPKSGSVIFMGEAIHGLAPSDICRKGVFQVPEGRKLFPRMKVIENLEMGAYLPQAKMQFQKSLKKIYQLFPILEERRKQMAGTLSGGEQQMLVIARSLMALPTLLMLDELTMGLAPKIAMEIFDTLKKLNQERLTLFLVTQEILRALNLAHRAYVLENGRVIMEGTGKELVESPKVKEAYLGI